MIFGDGVNIDFLAIALAFAVPAAAAAMSQGKAISAAWDRMARQPEVSDSIGGKLVIALAFPEALGIFGLLLAIMLMGKLS